MKEKISTAFKTVQDFICKQLEAIDGSSKFQEDLWTRKEGGGGRTRIINQGGIFEKGGVNFSEVHGPVTDLMKQQLNLEGDYFYATGVSIVLHPINPFHPIMHMNIRYFEMDEGKTYWFGGGIDMTPHYVNRNAARDFHSGLKRICDNYSLAFYPKFKEWADNYFYIPHREETRGVGGIFYDHQKASAEVSKEELLQFAIDLGEAFPTLYKHQIELAGNPDYTTEHVRWRNVRRGRYVEFNLVHDRGTKFGLKTGGRIESILMSLPQTAEWHYDYQVKNKIEQETISLLKRNINWLEEN
jgi:coproporphyrinogen III oxidase